MHILNQVQINLIYNTNRNLFLWIEFSFLQRSFTIQLPTDGRATCQIGIKNASKNSGGCRRERFLKGLET